MNLIMPEIMNFEKSLNEARKMKKTNEIKEFAGKLAFLQRRYKIRNLSAILHFIQVLSPLKKIIFLKSFLF